jgi:DNA-binding CsgD family transcriptional regulator
MSNDTTRELIGTSLGGLLSPDAISLYIDLLRSDEVDVNQPAASELVDHRLAIVSQVSSRLIMLPARPALARALANATQRWLDSAPDITAILAAVELLDDAPPGPAVETADIDDQDDRERTLESLLIGATHQVRLLQPYYDWMSEDEFREGGWADAHDPHESSGARWRCVYDGRLFGVPGWAESVQEELRIGVDIRITDGSLPSFLLIVDDAAAAYTPVERGPGAVSTDSGLVRLLGLAFEAVWDRSTSLSTREPLTSMQQAVLAMIGLGQTNGMIAQSLGVNERTVRRRVGELLDHFGEVDRAGLVRQAVLATSDD